MPAHGPSEPVPVIALDGLSGSGKSTLARRLAERLGWTYLDSGAWYRALAWAARERGVDPTSAADLLALLSEIEILGRPDGTVVVDGRELRGEIRSPEIDELVTEVADRPEVRAALNRRMRRLRRQAGVAGVVADGRDAGSVIFPDAALKVFVDASLEVRADRRYRQRLASGRPTDRAEVLRALAARDARDAARGESAPRRVPGSVLLDNNELSVEEAIRRLLNLARPLLAPGPARGQP
ncbi:MAG: (d)CMP kinase [Planctomycetota bacterium]|nr:MAG: (d)CMP kinase [Planctomycetota bacterium]